MLETKLKGRRKDTCLGEQGRVKAENMYRVSVIKKLCMGREKKKKRQISEWGRIFVFSFLVGSSLYFLNEPSTRMRTNWCGRLYYVPNLAQKSEQIPLMSEGLGELMWTCPLFY